MTPSHQVMHARSYTAPDFRLSALLTIDTQRDVLDGQPLEVPGTSAALPNIRALAEAFRAEKRPIAHVVRLYRRDGSNVDLCRRRAVEEGARMLYVDSEGAQLAAELLPDPEARLDADLLLSGGLQNLGEDEFVVYKPRWGAFFQTPLEAHLRERGVTTVVFAGCNFPNCPRTSIYEASERDFRIVVAGDAVSGMYHRGEAELRDIGVNIMRTGKIVAELAMQVAVT
jgi:nicotinamidase-related amidase